MHLLPQTDTISDTLTLPLSSIIHLSGKCDFWVLFTNTVDEMVFPSTSVLQQQDELVLVLTDCDSL